MFSPKHETFCISGLQVFSGSIPFHEINGDFAVALKVMQGQRPPRPLICEPWKYNCDSVGLDDAMWALIEDSWRMKPEERLTAKEIVDKLFQRVGSSVASSSTAVDPQPPGPMSWSCFIREHSSVCSGPSQCLYYTL
jgi:hypothetical protein